MFILVDDGVIIMYPFVCISVNKSTKQFSATRLYFSPIGTKTDYAKEKLFISTRKPENSLVIPISPYIKPITHDLTVLI